LFTVSSAIGVIFLNIYFIEKIGFIGAAISTMIIIILFNTLKLIFVMLKFKIQPFSKKTILISVLILTTYFAFFNLNLSADFLINLILKSILIFSTYLTISYFLNLSDELNLFLKINRKGKF
jgi:O-antigen/teichoic acid export membrane protein